MLQSEREVEPTSQLFMSSIEEAAALGGTTRARDPLAFFRFELKLVVVRDLLSNLPCGMAVPCDSPNVAHVAGSVVDREALHTSIRSLEYNTIRFMPPAMMMRE